jgi:phosphoribulokinase
MKKELFCSYGENGTGIRRRYIHDEQEAALNGSKPGTFTEWEELPPDSDLLATRGLLEKRRNGESCNDNGIVNGHGHPKFPNN